MRIMMLSWEYPPRIIGGISRHVEELADALARRDLEIHVITCEVDGAPEEEVIDGVFIHRVPADGDMAADFVPWIKSLNAYTERKVDELLAAEPDTPTLLHAHDWLSEFAAASLKNKHKIPLVATIHATEHGRNYGIHTDMQRYISHVEWELSYEAWRVIVCSEFMTEEVNHALATPLDKMDVVPNGVKADKFNFAFPDKDEFRAFYAAPDEKIIFHVGRNVREKGGQVLINAFKKLLSDQPNSKLVIAGGGNRGWLKDQAEALGISDRIYFTGFVDDLTLLKIYKVSDVAVFPSLYEPFGIVALEAMAARVPVVVSDIGGLREVVDHDINGIVTWADNSDSLAWGILEAFRKSPLQVARMVDAAYEKATTVFSWDKIAEQTEAVYKRTWAEYTNTDWK
ncbi:MAG: glycosyltransferase family 4 protein [Armatimonadota bacterium]|nr:glycosyltransferase family 4 protein [bacterium]